MIEKTGQIIKVCERQKPIMCGFISSELSGCIHTCFLMIYAETEMPSLFPDLVWPTLNHRERRNELSRKATVSFDSHDSCEELIM